MQENNPRVGRNEPCWCGSGEKFKKCHLNRAAMPKRTLQEIIETAQTAYAKKYCLHPDQATCNRGIIKAHSVQQHGGLSKIAIKGQVYSFKDNNVGDIAKGNGLAIPKLVIVGKASTFTGFCGLHDDQTFAPIEKHPFISCPEHAFLLGYRHFCTELFTKRAAASLLPTLRQADRGKPLEFQFALQQNVDVFQEGFDQGFKDVEKIKAKYDEALLSKDFSHVQYYIVRFNEVPDLLCCSGYFPAYDFDGVELQSLLVLNKIPDHVNFSIVTTDKGGAAVFSWLGDNNASERLVKSLHKMSDAELPNAIIRHTFEYCENSYISPVWWDALNEKTKMALRQRISNAANGLVERKNTCLMDDGHRYVKWTVAARESNLTI